MGKPRASKPRAPRQAVLINFFGVNCKPCKEEIPYLKGLLKQYEKDGLQLIMITKDKRDLVQAYIDQRQLHEPKPSVKPVAKPSAKSSSSAKLTRR